MTESFTTESGCEAYLKRRFSAAKWQCPQCREPKGHWLCTRQRWECGHCGAQIGLRYGTVFERSRLPLTIWFLAIRAFAARTSITSSELLAFIGLARPATAQAMLRRIRSAVTKNDLAVGLAGLTTYPISSDVMNAWSQNLQNEKTTTAQTAGAATVDPDATSASGVHSKKHLNEASQPPLKESENE